MPRVCVIALSTYACTALRQSMAPLRAGSDRPRSCARHGPVTAVYSGSRLDEVGGGGERKRAV